MSGSPGKLGYRKAGRVTQGARPCQDGTEDEERRELATEESLPQQGDRRPGENRVRLHGDRNRSFQTSWTRSPVPVMSLEAMCPRESHLLPL